MTLSASIEQDKSQETSAAAPAEVAESGTVDSSAVVTPTAAAAAESLSANVGIPGVDDEPPQQENNDEEATKENKPEDNESLVVHVDESALAEIDAELTSTPRKSGGEDDVAGGTGDDSNKADEDEKNQGKEKWESETPEKSKGEKIEADKQGEGGKSDEKTADGKSAKDSSTEKKSPASGSAASRSKRFVFTRPLMAFYFHICYSKKKSQIDVRRCLVKCIIW